MNYKERRKGVIDALGDNSFFVFFNKRPDEDASKYAVERNFLYLTGLFEFDDILLLGKHNGKKVERLYIHEIDPMQERWTGPTIREAEAKEISKVEHVGIINNFMNDLMNLLDESSKLYCLFKEDDTQKYSYEDYFIRTVLDTKKVTIVNGNNILKRLRSVKEQEEADMIRKANLITWDGVKNILDNLKPGLKEYQIEAKFDEAIKFNGATGFSFPTIAASGINSTCLHYTENKDTLQDGDLILFDLGASLNTYCADVSRTFPVNGKFSERQKLVYEIVLNCQKMIESKARPGYTTRDLNEMVIDFFAKELKKLGLIKDRSEVRKYYFHGVSHHLGMVCHDFCIYDELKPGAIISNEPGLYIPEWKIGVRIEDDLYITENGCINLSAGIIKEVSDIEEYMANRK